MAEAITAETGAATPKPLATRRLHPGLAFLAGLLGIGLGYMYVGRIAYAIAFMVAQYLVMCTGAWTRVIVDPVGWYVSMAGLVLLWLVQLVHPVAIAWAHRPAPAKRYKRWPWYIAWITGSVAISFVLVPDDYAGAFGYTTYYVPGGSMSPALQPGDRIVVDTWRYRDDLPMFGDIVVCDFGDGIRNIKRVVGVPGDTIELRGPQLVRNGSPVDLSAERGLELPNSPPITLDTDEFFVLGDFRGNSYDSRQRGPLARDQISGRAEFIYFSRFGGVKWDRFAMVLGAE
jgi:signal peptidase I